MLPFEHGVVTRDAPIMRVARVLVIDGNAAERAELCAMLTSAKHEVETAAAAATGLGLARASQPDLVVVELGLPDASGSAVCRSLRSDPATRAALLFVLASNPAEAERVEAFEAGADDLVVRPYSKREVMLRLAALLRRRRAVVTAPFVTAGPLRIDPGARRATLDGRPLELTRREFDLLLLLAEGKGRVHTRDSLVGRLWPDDVDSGRVVDTTMKRLRRKLGSAAAAIQTVRGAGYRLAIDNEG